MNTLPVYRTRGSGNTTVFLLHGAYGDGRYFDDLANSLAAAGYRVVDWDAPGYGESPASEPATIEAFAEAAQAMIRKEGTATNVVLGHSMGALIGPRLTNAEDKVNGLILSAGSMGLPSRSPEEQKTFLDERLAPLEQGMTVQEYARPLITHMMAKGASGPLVDKVFEVVLGMRTETFRASLNAITLYDGRSAVASLTKPTLMIAGEFDPACSAAGMQMMHEAAPHSEFHIIEGVGHYGFAEKPEVYKGLVLDWLSRNFPN
ncbi:MAG: alpha/beta hydrolase [Rhodobacter sp.]|nr:alpha/beta hydrolase [Paracoccaceae bacterium]MCC0076361.1 alpha/beta hydrolase [Rhodobacter sp.]